MTFVKNDAGKPRFSLIPPEVELEVAKAFTHGATKYGPQNYRKGTAWSRYVDAMRRHMNAWQLGQENDEESGLSHLAHAIASLQMLFTLQLMQVGEDDRWVGAIERVDPLPTLRVSPGQRQAQIQVQDVGPNVDTTSAQDLALPEIDQE